MALDGIYMCTYVCIYIYIHIQINKYVYTVYIYVYTYATDVYTCSGDKTEYDSPGSAGLADDLWHENVVLVPTFWAITYDVLDVNQLLMTSIDDEKMMLNL